MIYGVYFQTPYFQSLNCRTEGSLKSDELKKIYNNCLKQQEGKNYSDSKNSSEDWQGRGFSDRSENERNKNRRDREDNKNRQEPKNWMDDRSDRSVYESGDNRQNFRDQGMNGKNQNNDYGKSYNQNDRRIDNNRRMEGNYRANDNNQQNDHNIQDFYQKDDYGTVST